MVYEICRPADTDSNWAVMQVNACRLLASEANTLGLIVIAVDNLLENEGCPVSLNIMYQYSNNKRSKIGTTPDRT